MQTNKRGKYKRDLNWETKPPKSHEKPTEHRVCLTCKKDFMSFGNFNRICDGCKRTKDFDDAGWHTEYEIKLYK